MGCNPSWNAVSIGEPLDDRGKESASSPSFGIADGNQTDRHWQQIRGTKEGSEPTPSKVIQLAIGDGKEFFRIDRLRVAGPGVSIKNIGRNS